ncbi:MAG: hypothetical protein C4589_04475 [Peptococcaceae bacterium]|jgi:hypothetical protein|nr:MAG: hypothetical protein C4589_04475 [Peptococcaceae bacterium]
MLRKWISVFVTCLLFFAFVLPVQAADPAGLRQKFDSLDTVNGGNWFKDANNDQATLAWGESYVMDAYVTMYDATGDTRYLDKLVTHANAVLAQRDSVRGVTDYRGLSLPAWRNGRYTKDGEYYIFAVHTGMITYPLARFAQIVAADPSLQNYQAAAATFLQAAKDAVAVHDDEWVDRGDTGYYQFRAGAPYKQAGLGLPFNQYLALARTELVLYQVTGDARYLDRVQKMFRHFKSYLVTDPAIDGYKWQYSAFYRSSVEDIGHAAIDVNAAFLAYRAGIVFTGEDMQKFANTGAKKLILPDGKIANNITGEGTTPYEWLFGMWVPYAQFASTIFDTAYQKITAMAAGGGSGLLAAAMLNKANADPSYGAGKPVSEQPAPGGDPGSVQKPGELIVNGDFSRDKTGWGGRDVVVKTESNGNKYGAAKYGWAFYQYVPVEPGTQYILTAGTRKGTAASRARIAYFYYNEEGKQLASKSIYYSFKGNGWEHIPASVLTAPAGASKVLIKLLVDGGSGTHDFDNVSLIKK